MIQKLRSVKLENHQLGLVLSVAIYLAATLTTLGFYGIFADVIWRLGMIIASVLVYVSIVFLIAQMVRRLDIVDVAWGGGFVVAAIASLFASRYSHDLGWNVQTLVAILVIIWAARLAYYILRRVASHPEDKRYDALRKKWKGNVALNAYLRIFVLQGLLASVISIVVIQANLSEPTGLGLIAWLGLAIWVFGFLFEAIGDWQLRRHLAKPSNKGKLMTSGLWRYTRHPNYFGEATMWWGIFIITASTPFGVAGIISPLIITYLLLFVSGVPLAETALEGRKGWKAYKRKTSMFIPLMTKG